MLPSSSSAGEETFRADAMVMPLTNVATRFVSFPNRLRAWLSN
jgi:hypothetical protein